jgi:hypothetical protein
MLYYLLAVLAVLVLLLQFLEQSQLMLAVAEEVVELEPLAVSAVVLRVAIQTQTEVPLQQT